MATTPIIGVSLNNDTQLRDIKYNALTFNDVKQELLRLVSLYYPDVSVDLSPNSGVSVILDLVSYVCDVLSYVNDKNFNELILSRIWETKNLYDVAKGLGYSPRSVRPSNAVLNFSIDLPVTGSSTSNYYFSIASNATFQTNSGNNAVTFQPNEPIIFDNATSANWNANVVTNSNGIVVTRLSRNDINVVSGTVQPTSHLFDGNDTFKTFTIADTNGVTEILSAVDSNGDEWNEVVSLAQEYVFTGIPNINASSTSEPSYLLTMKRVPRRFVVSYNPDGTADLSFGVGDIDLTSTEFILNPTNFVFPNQTSGTFRNFTPDSIQMTDFLNTTTLGVAPKNITISFTYRVGGGVSHNVAANTITKIGQTNISFFSNNISGTVQNLITKSISVNNPEAAQGGADQETQQEITQAASFNYAAQDRVVSINDYLARVSSLPPEYGTVFRIVAQQTKNQSIQVIQSITDLVGQLVTQRQSGIEDQLLLSQIQNLNNEIKNDASDVTLYCCIRNSYGWLVGPTETLKNNIITYLNNYKILSDTISIDALQVLNFGVRFTINADVTRFSPSQVLLNCLAYLQSVFDTNNMNPGMTINIDGIVSNMLQSVQGIVSVPEFALVNLGGVIDNRQYSNDFLNQTIDQFMSHNSTIFSVKSTVIPELRYGTSDIIGRFDN